VKLPSANTLAVALVFALYVLMVVARWGYKAANQGGFPFLSVQTLEAIWPWLALLVAALLITWFVNRNSDPK